jgi:PAS domain-containing protein
LVKRDGKWEYIENTKRIMVEEILWETKENFWTTARKARDAIIMLDSEGRIIYWNPAAETIFEIEVF